MRDRLGDAPLTLIALSGYGQEGDRERSRIHGFAAHLVKPTEVPALLELIARAGSPDFGTAPHGARTTTGSRGPEAAARGPAFIDATVGAAK